MNTQQAELYQKIVTFNVDSTGTRLSFTSRLARENGWSGKLADRVVREYKKFAFLAMAAGHPVTPSDQVDQAWHLHLTYTRSYWDEFCPDVLGGPLHHSPTKGGTSENAKFGDWYNRTLDSYCRLFDEEPPADIWPSAETRFGTDLHHRRVNVKENWVVSKQPLVWIAVAVTLMLASVFLTGCEPVPVEKRSLQMAFAEMTLFDPLNVKGTKSLAFFATAFAVSLLVAAVIRHLMRGPNDEPQPEALELDAYEVAYLAGGRETMVQAALASLVSRDVLELDDAGSKLSRNCKLDGLNVHPVEKTVYDVIDPYTGTRVAGLSNQPLVILKVTDRLQHLGLIVEEDRALAGTGLSLLIALAVPLFGAVKILYGLSRDKPVGFLVDACIVSALFAVAAYGQKLHRTRRGDRALTQFRMEASLKEAPPQESLAGLDLAMSVGLNGTSILAEGPQATLHTALSIVVGDDGGCGGDGGGCGGCGGCGCG